MAKVTWKGWQTDASNAATPTGPGKTRDGYLIIGFGQLELARKLAEYHRSITSPGEDQRPRPPRKKPRRLNRPRT